MALHTTKDLIGMHNRNEVRLFRVKAPVRDAKIRVDKGGDGHFGAPRHRRTGAGTHQGIDLATKVGQTIHSPIDGTVIKLGWVNKTHRYVAIRGSLDLKDLNGNVYPGEACVVRLLYLTPIERLKEGSPVSVGDVIG